MSLNYDPKDFATPGVGFHSPGMWLRPAIIQKVNQEKGLVDIEWLDHPGIRRDVEITQPQLGIFQMPVVGAAVLIGFDQGRRAKILRNLPIGYEQQIKPQGDLWAIQPGELLLQSYVPNPIVEVEYPAPASTGTSFYMNNVGDISMITSSGEKWIMDNTNNEINQNSMNFTCNTEAGKLQFGLVKRELIPGKDEDIIITTGGTFTSATAIQEGLTEFRLRLLETADIDANTLPEVDTEPFIELVLGTKVNNKGDLVKTNNTHAVPDEEIMIQLKTKANQGFEFTVDKRGNLTVIVKGDVKFKIGGNADINVTKDAKITASKVEVDSSNIKLGGTDKLVLESFLSKYNLHTHPVAGTATTTPLTAFQSTTSDVTRKVTAE